MFQSQENGLLYIPDYFFSWLAEVNSGQITSKPQVPWMTLLLMANAWPSGGMHMGLSAFPAIQNKSLLVTFQWVRYIYLDHCVRYI